MKTIIFQTNYNAVPRLGESNNLPSKTIPGDSYTIRELMEKFARGQIPPIAKQTYFDDPEDFDEIDPTKDPSFDLSDATQMRESLDEGFRSKKAQKQASRELAKSSAEMLQKAASEAQQLQQDFKP